MAYDTLALEPIGANAQIFQGFAPTRELNGRFELKEISMSKAKNLFVKVIKDEQGGEVLEYALIAGLIVVAAIAVITAIGGKVLARWNSLNNSL
ncbi:MAG: Flp family type IVb pilin [Tepidisphaeraceae bacterium]